MSVESYYRPVRQGVVLQLSTERDPVSASIRYLTRSPYSHVDFVLPAGLKLPDGTVSVGGELLGARMGGVQVRPLDYAKFSRKQLYLCREAPWAVYEYAISQIGKPYDYRGIVNFFVQDRNWRDDDKWFCSELAEASFEHGYRPLILVENADRVTPRDTTLSTDLIKIPPEWTLGGHSLTIPGLPSWNSVCLA